jgi:putative phosphoesterase
VPIRLGLLGDTHIPEAGNDLPSDAYELLAGCDRILHCGDLHSIETIDRLERVAPTVVSRGNGDNPRTRRGAVDDPRIVDHFVADFDTISVGLTHDLEHLEDQDDDDVAKSLELHFGRRVDIAVCGHTHVPMVWGLLDGTAIVNPGSPTLPYGYRGVVGTVGFVDIDGSRFEISVVDLATKTIQLGLRGPARHALTRGPRPAGGR